MIEELDERAAAAAIARQLSKRTLRRQTENGLTPPYFYGFGISEMEEP